MFRVSQILRGNIFNNYSKRYFSDGAKNSMWILNSTEVLSDNIQNNNIQNNNIQNNNIQNNNIQNNNIQNTKTGSNYDYIKFGSLFIPSHRINEIRCISFSDSDDSTTILYDDEVIKSDDSYVRDDVKNWSSKLPKINNENKVGIFVSCGPFIFNVNTLKEIEYISTNRERAFFLGEIIIRYKYNYSKHSIICNPSSGQFKEFKSWMEKRSEVYNNDKN